MDNIKICPCCGSVNVEVAIKESNQDVKRTHVCEHCGSRWISVEKKGVLSPV